MDRLDALRWIAGTVAGAALPSPALATDPASAGPTQTVRVPLDHDAPGSGSIDLPFLSLAPFDARRPTVIVVSDGQQFFITRDAFARSVGPLFDDRFNVVGVLHRVNVPDIQSVVHAGPATDWPAAYRLLCARQCIGDIDALRRLLVGPTGTVSLYGRSGGAAMAHTYASRYGEHVATMLTQAAVDNQLEALFGLESDHFWDEIAPADRTALTKVLVARPALRTDVVAVLQRQNFFVARAQLAQARHRLIQSLAAARREVLDAAISDYQVRAVRGLFASAIGPGIAVRLFELAAPSIGRYDFTRTDRLWPDHESDLPYIAPLLAALRAGTLAVPIVDHAPLHAVTAQVTLVAGRWDHTCDYRTQLALAACYPASRLFILDDDHDFHRMATSGQLRAITTGALSPRESAAYRAAEAALTALRWTE